MVGMGDFCLFLDLVIPAKFKIPEFKEYDGRTSPVLYLTIYTHSMATYIGNKKLIVCCFQHSLIGSMLY